MINPWVSGQLARYVVDLHNYNILMTLSINCNLSWIITIIFLCIYMECKQNLHILSKEHHESGIWHNLAHHASFSCVRKAFYVANDELLHSLLVSHLSMWVGSYVAKYNTIKQNDILSHNYLKTCYNNVHLSLWICHS